MTTTIPRCVTMPVADWRKNRRIFVQDGFIYFEVARAHGVCVPAESAHRCSMCTKHVAQTTAFLLYCEERHEWKEIEKGYWLVLPVEDGVSPLETLVRCTGLQINRLMPPVHQAAIVRDADLDGIHQQWTVDVSGWRVPRMLIIEPRRFLFQVTLQCRHCDDCHECVRIVDKARQAVDRQTYWDTARGWSNELFLVIPRRSDDKDPIHLLRSITGLPCRGLPKNA